MSVVQPWAADEVSRRPIAGLAPYARNARTHSPEQVDQIAASILEWGWTMPVLVDEAGCIIAGHGRIMAAQKLGLTDVPVMVARGWSDAKKRAYVLADNKLALNAGWDRDMLRLELSDLGEAASSLAGFSSTEFVSLTAPDSALGNAPGAAPAEGLTLIWGSEKIPLSPEQAAALDAALDAHATRNGVLFGFVNALLAE